MKRLGFLASGRGSNMQAIVDACRAGKLSAIPAVVISNNADAQVLQRARDQQIAAIHLSSKTHPDAEELDAAITDTFMEHKVDLVILAGYMKKIGPRLLLTYENRIINIHPSLLPKYGGQGMYGLHVHEAVINAGEKETGVSIHLVNDEYDRGRILAQCAVNVEPNDTVQSLAQRVLAVEHNFYVETLNKILTGEISLE